MADLKPYPTGAGVEAAIKDAAKKAAAADPSLDTDVRIRLEYFNRFLSRVFSKGDDSQWLLKGGTGSLYPVVDQIADKVCATMQTYHDRPSSREKDLVDLVVLAVTQDVDGTALSVAITTGARLRLMEPFDHFVVPIAWGRRYATLAKPVPYCADFRTVDLARELVAKLIDPVLAGTAPGRAWSPHHRAWQ